MVNNIIFDLDGVLWELDFNKLGNLMAEDLGIPSLKHEEFIKDLKDVINLILKNIDKKITKGLILDIIKPIAIKYNVTVNKFYELLTNENYEICKNNSKALDVIKTLYQKNYKLWVKTNWFENVQIANLKRYGYLPYFEKIVGILDDYLKPNPKALDKIIEEKSPKDFIIIGDTPKKEIQLGNLIGMKSIWLNSSKTEKPQDKLLISTYEVEDITGILEIL